MTSLETAIEYGDCDDCDSCVAHCYNLGYCRQIENEQQAVNDYNDLYNIHSHNEALDTFRRATAKVV